MQRQKGRILSFLTLLVMTAVICLTPAIRADADAERYTIVFRCENETEVLEGVRLNTDEASISYDDLQELIGRLDASIFVNDEISTAGSTCGQITDDYTSRKVTVTGAFDGQQLIVVRCSYKETAIEVFVTCTEYHPAPAPDPDPDPADPQKPEVTPPTHYHIFEWVTLTQATSSSDGMEYYVCKECGDIKDMRPVSSLWVQNEEITTNIRNAPAGARLSIQMNNCNTFGRSIRDAMVARPDVTVSASFLSEGHKGVPLKVTFPAGCDIASLYDANGYLGLCRAGSTLGYAPAN